jgi:hypothetical protein
VSRWCVIVLHKETKVKLIDCTPFASEWKPNLHDVRAAADLQVEWYQAREGSDQFIFEVVDFDALDPKRIVLCPFSMAIYRDEEVRGE